MSTEIGQRRIHERVPFFCPVWAVPKNGGLSAEARSFDISPGGVGLSTAGSMPAGTGTLMIVTPRLHHPKHGRREEPVVGRVARMNTDDGGILLGIDFLEAIRSETHPRLTRAVEKL